MQLSSMSPRERHSSGTVITINHNLLPVYMSLSTPCFNFIKHNQVFCTPVLSLRFRNLFLFPPKIMLYILFPHTSLNLSLPASQHSSVALSEPICSSWVDCHFTKLLPWPVASQLTSWVHMKLRQATSEGLVLLSGEAGLSRQAISVIIAFPYEQATSKHDPTAAQQLKRVKVVQEILASLQQRLFYYLPV